MSAIENEVKKIDQTSIVKAKPGVILKEEADNWGILYDPNSDLSFAINTVGAFTWKQIDTGSTVNDILSRIKEVFIDVPPEVEADVMELIERLLEKELISLENRGQS